MSLAEPEVEVKAVKPIIEPVTKLPIDAKQLLAEAPEVPYITKVEDAVEFVDKYAKWKRKVKQST